MDCDREMGLEICMECRMPHAACNCDDMGAMWRAHKERNKAKRRHNTANSTQILIDAGVPFDSKNGGAHLIIYHSLVSGPIDFWPSTGLFIDRSDGKRRYGVANLIKHMGIKP